MTEKNCQIVLVGHNSHKLILSIDKEIAHKLIFITEREPLAGTLEAKKVLAELNTYYKERRIDVENVMFDFHVQTKPIAELIHLIYQQKLQKFENISINISGGLRYMDIWFYIACSITKTKILHGDFIYEKNKEVGIYSNVELQTIPYPTLTDKQFEFLTLFFGEYENYTQFFDPKLSFTENSLLNQRKTYQSLEGLKAAMEKVRKTSISRGALNGFVQKLSLISALNIDINPLDKKEKSIEISYFGIAYFLHALLHRQSYI